MYKKNPQYGTSGYDDTQAPPYTPPPPPCVLPNTPPSLKLTDTYALAGPSWEAVVDYTTYLDVASITACPVGETTVEIYDQDVVSRNTGTIAANPGLTDYLHVLRETGFPTPIISCLLSDLGDPANQETFTCLDVVRTHQRFIVLRQPDGSYLQTSEPAAYNFGGHVPDWYLGGDLISMLGVTVTINSDVVNCPPIAQQGFSSLSHSYLSPDGPFGFPQGQTSMQWDANLSMVSGLPFFFPTNFTLPATMEFRSQTGNLFESTAPYAVTIVAPPGFTPAYASLTGATPISDTGGGFWVKISAVNGDNTAGGTSPWGQFITYATQEQDNRNPMLDPYSFYQKLYQCSTIGTLNLISDGVNATVTLGELAGLIGTLGPDCDFYLTDNAGHDWPRPATLGYPGPIPTPDSPGYRSLQELLDDAPRILQANCGAAVFTITFRTRRYEGLLAFARQQLDSHIANSEPVIPPSYLPARYWQDAKQWDIIQTTLYNYWSGPSANVNATLKLLNCP